MRLLMEPANLASSGAYTIRINYTASSTTSFNWNIPLYDILPKGVIVTSITMTGIATML